MKLYLDIDKIFISVFWHFYLYALYECGLLRIKQISVIPHNAHKMYLTTNVFIFISYESPRFFHIPNISVTVTCAIFKLICFKRVSLASSHHLLTSVYTNTCGRFIFASELKMWILRAGKFKCIIPFAGQSVFAQKYVDRAPSFRCKIS